MVNAARIVQAWLISEGLGTAVATNGAWPVFVYNRPDTPDAVLVVYNTGADSDGTIQRTGESVLHETVQVYLRATTDDPVYVKGLAIQAAMDSVRGTLVSYGGNTYKIHSFRLVTPLTFLGEEEKNKRRQYFINGRLTITEV
jgi:hypothetical protein